jgi:hypothetical protein
MDTVTTPLQKLVEFLPYIIPIVLLELILIVIALVDLVRREKARYLPKWAWAILIIFIQFLGAIGYLIFGRED